MLNKENKGGLYNQLKNNKPESPTKYTKEYIKEVFENLFKTQDKKENRKMSLHPFGWIHNTWEEDGQHYSSWTFNSGYSMFTTGDKGKEEFDKLFAEGFKDKSKTLK